MTYGQIQLHLREELDPGLHFLFRHVVTLVLLNPDMPCLNSVDPDQLSSEKKWSGSALFAIQYVNLYKKSGSRNLIGWQLEVGEGSSFIQHDKGFTKGKYCI